MTYEGFSRQDLLDRLGALNEEYMDLQHVKEGLWNEMKTIEKLLEDFDD